LSFFRSFNVARYIIFFYVLLPRSFSYFFHFVKECIKMNYRCNEICVFIRNTGIMLLYRINNSGYRDSIQLEFLYCVLEHLIYFEMSDLKKFVNTTHWFVIRFILNFSKIVATKLINFDKINTWQIYACQLSHKATFLLTNLNAILYSGIIPLPFISYVVSVLCIKYIPKYMKLEVYYYIVNV
jgi:hypothetical protein